MRRRTTTSQVILVGALCAGLSGWRCAPAEDDVGGDIAAENTLDTPTALEETSSDVETPDRVADIGSDDTQESVDAAPIERPPEVPAILGGSFVDLTTTLDAAPPFVIADDDVEADVRAEVTVGLFVDLNGDDVDEVVLSAPPRHLAWVNRAYHVGSDGLQALPKPTLPGGNVVLAEDLDGDGHGDLLSISVQDPPLFWGNGHGGWSEPQTLGDQTLYTTERMALYLADLDNDGWLDLLADGYCELVPFFRVRERAYLAQPHLLQGFPTPSAYAVMSVQIDALGPTLLALGNVTCDGPQESSFGVASENSQGYPLFEPITIHGPDPPWLTGQSDTGGFEALTYQAPMGVAAGDLNGDSLVDLVLPLDPIHAIFLGQAEGPMLDISGDTQLARLPDDQGNPMLAWGSALLDLDRDGRPDLIMAHGDDGSRFKSPPGDAPPMWTTAHINTGDLRFADATDQLGLGKRGRWRSLAVGDPDRDGDPDLVVGGVGELPRVYMNELETPHSGFSLRLRGNVSNHLGIGALVEVEAAGIPTQYHYVGGVASPNVVSAPIVFIGLGESTGPVTTRVRWPSGLTQEVVDLPTGTMHIIEEPEVVTLNPVGRHIPADGVSELEIVVTPQLPTTDVLVEIVRGPGTLEPATPQGDGSWTATLMAPTIPGNVQLSISIDGVALKVRPRVWFDTL